MHNTYFNLLPGDVANELIKVIKSNVDTTLKLSYKCICIDEEPYYCHRCENKKLCGIKLCVTVKIPNIVKNYKNIQLDNKAIKQLIFSQLSDLPICVNNLYYSIDRKDNTYIIIQDSLKIYNDLATKFITKLTKIYHEAKASL